jgi:hypothetical protein
MQDVCPNAPLQHADKGTARQGPDMLACGAPADQLLAALHEVLRSAKPAPLALLAALARAAAAVPLQLLRPAVPRLLPWLLEALRRLQVSL